MKKTIRFFMIFAAVTTLLGCRKQVEEFRGVGRLALEVSASGDYITKAGEVNTDDFTVNITRKIDGWKQSFDKFSEMPSSLELSAAEYTIEVSSPQVKPAAFDQPVYGGSKDFTVKAGETVPVTVEASLQNVKVSVIPDVKFMSEIGSFTITVSNGEGVEHTLIWTKDDILAGAKDGYFSVAPLSIHVDGYRSLDNTYASLDKVIADVNARDYFKINLTANTTGQIGGISITVDTTTNDRDEEINVPGFDEIPVPGDPKPDPEPDPEPSEPEQPTPPETEEPGTPAPSMEWPSNPTFAPIEITDNVDVALVVKAPGKIKDFVVSVSDNFKDAIAVIASPDMSVSDLDLIKNTYAIEMLSQVAPTLPTGDQLLGKESVDFALSDLIPMISEVGDPGSDYIFTLSVTDELGQNYTKSLTFQLK